MKASVIIPAFRLEPYIGPCLESVLAQETNFDFEVIVCDDKSPDGTIARCGTWRGKAGSEREHRRALERKRDAS
jgi:glycosyltransferase involved in cell wall biosynthesis